MAELEAVIGGVPPDLQNVEVYYRLGLAHAAVGNWQAAFDAFNSVEEASPGYRDAEKRAEELAKYLFLSADMGED